MAKTGAINPWHLGSARTLVTARPLPEQLESKSRIDHTSQCHLVFRTFRKLCQHIFGRSAARVKHISPESQPTRIRCAVQYILVKLLYHGTIGRVITIQDFELAGLHKTSGNIDQCRAIIDLLNPEPQSGRIRRPVECRLIDAVGLCGVGITGKGQGQITELNALNVLKRIKIINGRLHRQVARCFCYFCRRVIEKESGNIKSLPAVDQVISGTAINKIIPIPARNSIVASSTIY